MKFKGTWVLLLIAVALGLYVYLIEIKKAQKDEEKKEAAEKVLDVDTAKVKSIDLKNTKGEFSLEKGDGDTWKLTKPLADEADSNTVKTMLSSITSEKFDESIDTEDFKNFGLDAPSVTVTLTMQDGGKKKVSIGIDAPIPGKTYLRREDDKKALYANSGIKLQLDKALKDLREKKVFRKNKDDVTHIVLKFNTKDNHGQISLTKKDNDWIIDSNGEKADGDVVLAYLNGVTGLNASDFPSEKGTDKAEQKKYGLNAPAVDVTLEGKNNATISHLLLSAPKMNVVYATVEGSPTVFSLFESSTTNLHKKPQDFRNKKIPFEFKKEDVAEIVAKTSTADSHLVKKGSSWELNLPDETLQVNQIQVTSFLDKVAELKVADYIDASEKPEGLNPPVGHILLKDPKGETLLDFSWGDRAKVQRNDYAKTNKYKGNFTVENSLIAGVPIQTLVDKKATPTPAAAAKPATPAAAMAPSAPAKHP